MQLKLRRQTRVLHFGYAKDAFMSLVLTIQNGAFAFAFGTKMEFCIRCKEKKKIHTWQPPVLDSHINARKANHLKVH